MVTIAHRNNTLFMYVWSLYKYVWITEWMIIFDSEWMLNLALLGTVSDGITPLLTVGAKQICNCILVYIWKSHLPSNFCDALPFRFSLPTKSVTMRFMDHQHHCYRSYLTINSHHDIFDNDRSLPVDTSSCTDTARMIDRASCVLDIHVIDILRHCWSVYNSRL